MYNIIVSNNTNKYIEVLKKKGLKISDQEIDKIKEILFKENYLSIIENYEEPFLDSSNPQKFKDDIDFYSIFNLYKFDKDIKSIYFKYILKVEHQIKTVIANRFISLYGEKEYLKPENFDIYKLNGELDILKIKQVFDLIIKLESTLVNKLDKNEKISKCILKFGYVPFDLFINYLTLGEVSLFFKLMKEKDKNAVSKIFNLKSEELEIFLKNITFARNLCAHDEVFYNFKYKTLIKTNTIKNFHLLKIPFVKNNYLYGINDTYSIAIALFLILDKTDLAEFIELIENKFLFLSTLVNKEIIKIIQMKMGFGEEWKNIIYIKE